jgi:thymidylate synthase ThyX/predicted transcriptional regulator
MSSKRPVSPGAEEILGSYFPVLDHGFVALVDYMGTDECIERAARVSYGYGTRKASLTRGLLRYLRRHLHTTPSEMLELKFHCCMPMFIARQWIRHRAACLAGDARLAFDLPGAAKRGKRHYHSVPIAQFHRMWHHGSQHPMAKKKPAYIERLELEREYTIPELALLLDRREETLRNYVREGALEARRLTSSDPKARTILVSGAAWRAFATREHVATVDMKPRLREMRLRSCDEETGEIIHTSVVNVWESGIKPVFCVTLENGRRLKMSKDHRCLTEDGWFTLEQATGLQVNEDGGVTWRGNAPRFAVNGVPAYQDAAWLRARRVEGLDVQGIAERAGTSYHTIRKYLKKFDLQFNATERAKLSGVAQRGSRRTFKKPRQFGEAWREAVRTARKGAASNFWKGGVSTERESIGRWTSEQAPRVHARFDYRCATCHGKDDLHAHHVDPVWHAPAKAREFSNLLTLCAACHQAVHTANLELELLATVEQGANLLEFWRDKTPQPRPPAKRLPRATRLVRSFSRIEKIEFAGEEMTYDLEVAGPYHNFVADGFIVHNSVNEYSGRYSLMPMLFYTPSAEQLQTQSRSNNQGRSGTPVSPEQYADAVARWNEIRRHSRDAYEQMTSSDMARELARIDLPLSTYTQWYWKIDLHNFLHFLKLRVDRHAQWEIQEYGRVLAGMLKRVAPHSYEAWIDYDVCGARVSRMELDAMRRLVQVKDGGVVAAGGSLSATELDGLGLAKREIIEFLDKLAPTSTPDFELDLSQAKTAEWFASEYQKAVPKVDKLPE